MELGYSQSDPWLDQGWRCCCLICAVCQPLATLIVSQLSSSSMWTGNERATRIVGPRGIDFNSVLALFQRATSPLHALSMDPGRESAMHHPRLHMQTSAFVSAARLECVESLRVLIDNDALLSFG